MATLLSKKSTPAPIATDDEHHTIMAADPSIPQIPEGSTFGSIINAQTNNTSSSGFATFGSAPTTGFGTSSNFASAPASNFGSTTSAPVTANQQFQQPVLTTAGSNAAQDADVLVKNDNNDWINKRWRPAMGWMYMTVCIFDFIIFPIMWAVVQFWETQAANDAFRQWQPLTLQGAGLFHMAMGAIIGVTAYGRTKEKLAEKS